MGELGMRSSIMSTCCIARMVKGMDQSVTTPFLCWAISCRSKANYSARDVAGSATAAFVASRETWENQ